MSRATFRCDHCQTPVPLHARSCPKCGKVFDAVRCPRCTYVGDPPEFANGCPSCGYLAGPRRPTRRALFAPTMVVLLGLLAGAVALAWALRVG